MLQPAAVAASIVLAATALTSCASTVRAEDAPTYVTVYKQQSFHREARQGDRVHFSITVEPSDLSEYRLDMAQAIANKLTEDGFLVVPELDDASRAGVNFHCQVFVRYFGPLGPLNEAAITGATSSESTSAKVVVDGELTEADISGGLPGWENADGTALDRPVSPAAIPFAEASKNIFKGTRPFVIVVDISTGELIEGDGGPMSESRRVRRAFRVVGQTASKNRQTAIENLLTREVVDTSVVVEDGKDPATKRIPDFTGLARAVTNVMVAAPSTSMMLSRGRGEEAAAPAAATPEAATPENAARETAAPTEGDNADDQG
ncbi:MAG: hypothetical protein AAGB93_17120 [Planctomycetota bacterium]